MRTYFPGRGTLIEETLLAERSRAVVRVLETRGVALPDDARERILNCADPDVLDRWFDRAVVVDAAEEVFAEGTS